MSEYVPAKDPDTDNDPYFFVFCSEDGTNDGGIGDTGELQGRTIVSYTLTVKRVEYIENPTQSIWINPDPNTTVETTPYEYVSSNMIEISSSNQNAVTINGVNYPADTVVSMFLSSGYDNVDYSILCRIQPSGDGIPIDKTMIIPVRDA